MQLITKRQMSRLLPVAMLGLSFSSVASYVVKFSGVEFGSTTFWWSAHFLLLFLLFTSRRYYFDPLDKSLYNFVNIYVGWIFLQLVRGVFIAENYWDWKGLVSNSMALLMPIVVFSISDLFYLQKLFRSYIQYCLPFFLILFYFIPASAYGFYLAPVGLLICFFPLLPKNWKIIALVVAGIILFSDLSARSNVIKFAVPFLLLTIFYFRAFFTVSLLRKISFLFFIAPFILFYLAVTNEFNVFRMDEYISGNYVEQSRDAEGQKVTENLKSDTRTFLYVEVLQTAKKYDTWLLGRSPARGNETTFFYDADVTGRGERLANEVAILNIFTWTGIVGVVIYFLVFYKASVLAITRSQNIFAKMLGLFVAFRWAYAWVEDINNFTLSYFFLWVMIGMCYSESFRNMTDAEVKVWVRGIFRKNTSRKYWYASSPKTNLEF